MGKGRPPLGVLSKPIFRHNQSQRVSLRGNMAINPMEIVRPALEVAEPFSHSLSDAWNAVVGDRVAARRLKNAANLQLHVREEIARLGLALDPARIPERYAFSWFEEATKQDEAEIQILFARLLAKAAAGDEDASGRRHLEILSRFTPMDAAILNYFFETELAETKAGEDGQINDIDIVEYRLWSAVGSKFGERAWQSVEHLISLSVIERRSSINPNSVYNMLSNLQAGAGGEVSPSYGTSHELEIQAFLAATSTGLSLFRAISP